MKVQVNLSEELVQKIDNYAKAMGVSRSALCGVWLGQLVMSYERTIETSQNAIADWVKDMGTVAECKDDKK